MKTNSHEMLIASFTIFVKYEPNKSYAIDCSHDKLYACETLPEKMSKEDVASLKECGWDYDYDLDRWTLDL